MTQTLVLLFDEMALVFWTATIQFTLFGTALLFPMWTRRRRPSGRHFIALAAIGAALFSLLTAICSYGLGWDWSRVALDSAQLARVDERLAATISDRTSTSLVRAVNRCGLAAPDQPPAPTPTADEIVRKLAASCVNWTALSPALESLEYDFVSGSNITRVKVMRGQQRPHGVWIGTTLHAGFQELMKSPEKFAVEVNRGADPKKITVVANLKDGTKSIGVEAGNGVENSWRGYFSHGARGTTIVVDAERFVPLEEQTGPTTIRYSDWQEASAGTWIPRQIDVVGRSAHYRTRFAWLGGAAWLAGSSESIGPEETVTLTRTRNVSVNRRDAVMPATDEQRRSHAGANVVLSMLDHNRIWLDPGVMGVGSRTPFETLAYTFHTVREDVRVRCVLDRNGEVVFEVFGDGLGKMKNQLGNRSLALNTKEYASSSKGARFAVIYGRGQRERGQPFDIALKHYARIGCQFDLPLFRYRERLEFASISVEDGAWNGQPCRVATVSNLGDVFLGCGTMLAFTSWSYWHHVSPAREVVYIDRDRNVPIHETLTGVRDRKVFEIDFADYVEVEPGQWAPRSIRVEAKGDFTCEYQFQLVAGKYWMLKEVVSWFKPEEKSRGVIEDVRINGGRELLDDALRQVGATRTLFDGVGEPDRKVDVAAVSFALGRPVRVGPYEIRVTMQDEQTVSISASTNDASAPGVVALCFMDEKDRPVFAPSITLAEQAGARRGMVAIRGSRVWRAVRLMAASSMNANVARLPVSVVPFRWGDSIAVNIPALSYSENASGQIKEPDGVRTRAFQVRGSQAADGIIKLTVDIVSVDGPHEFYLDLAVMLLGESGEVISTGQCAASLRVEYQPVEKSFEVDMGKIREGAQPRFVAIGVASGNVISAPMGSLWGYLGNLDPPFDVVSLLAAPDEACRRVGLLWLDSREINSTIDAEFMSDWIWQPDERRLGDGPYSRRTLLKPHAAALVHILHEPGAPDVKARAARLLAYSEADGAADVLEPLAGDSRLEVQEAVAIGLTFLRRSKNLDRLRSFLSREVPLGKTEAEVATWRSFHRLEKDALIALAHYNSGPAVDLLGETLLRDLKNLRPVTDQKQQTSLDGRVDRVDGVCKLLGRASNIRAVHWLTAALDLIAGRPELARHFERSELAHSMLMYKEQTKGRIAMELETGHDPATWAYVVKDSSDPYFIPAVRKLFQRTDAPSHVMYSGVLYLWNIGTPQAVSALREAYDRGIMRDEPTQRLRLCEALAANGDGRGLADAYEILVGLKRPAQPPASENERKNWQTNRDNLLDQAEAVFGQAPKTIAAEFLAHKMQVDSSSERQVVLQLLWKLPELPKPLAAIVAQWAKSADREVADMSGRLLKRD